MPDEVPLKVIVTAADDQLAHLDDLARRLRAAGMAVDQVLEIGVVTGSVATSRVASLEALTGVAAVESDRSVSIAPPDADVQ